MTTPPPSRPKRVVPKGSLTILGTLPTLGRENRPGGFKGFMLQFWHQLSRCLITGVMVWVPLLVTLWVTWLVIHRVGFGTEKLIRDAVLNLNHLGQRMSLLHFLTRISYMPGFGSLLLLAVFLTTGLLARYFVTRKAIRFGEHLLERIPFVRTIYRAVQQIRDVFVRREGTVFQKVCLIEYPHPGIHAMGFITSKEQGIIQETLGKELVAIFMPTTPNPTSGFLLYMPPDAIIEINMSIEDAMKLIISGGAYLPDSAT